MRKSYVGITGFMSRQEVDAVLGAMPKDSDRLLMVGVLASQKTLRGEGNKWPNRYPEVTDIEGIFTDNPKALNLIHYNTKEPETLCEQLLEIAKLGGPNMHGFQLNVAWPSHGAIIGYRSVYRHAQIVLQIGGNALELVGRSPLRLAATVSRYYAGLVDYILLDPSGGKGEPFDTERAREYLQMLKEARTSAHLGVAGGLSPTTLGLVEPLVSDFPDLSIDAEGRLRDENDTLDLNVAREYVDKTLQIFAS